MRRAIITTAFGIALLAPTPSMAWDNFYDTPNQAILDSQRNAELKRMVDEMEYQHGYREYQGQVSEYEEAYPNENQQRAMKHYYQWPESPKR